MTHDPTQLGDRRPADGEVEAEASLSDAVIDALRSDAGPIAPPELEERTIRALQESGVLTSVAARPAFRASMSGRSVAFGDRRASLWVKAALAASLVFAAGYLLGGPRTGLRFGQPVHEYRASRGTHVTVHLSDGSRVTLAPESRLVVLGGFGAHNRSVELEGEAEFDVVHDSTRPFSVRAGHAIVVDVGTRFDLRAYATDTSGQVAVAEGAVTIGPYTPGEQRFGDARGAGVLVRSGEVGRFDARGHAVTAPIGTATTYFGWTSGVLVFEHEPLHDVLSSIVRWYDVDVSVPDTAVANRLVTAEFSTQSPSDLIRALAQAVDASVVGSGRTFTLVAK